MTGEATSTYDLAGVGSVALHRPDMGSGTTGASVQTAAQRASERLELVVESPVDTSRGFVERATATLLERRPSGVALIIGSAATLCIPGTIRGLLDRAVGSLGPHGQLVGVDDPPAASLPPELQAAIQRNGGTPASPAATSRAHAVLATAGRLCIRPDRVAITRSAGVAITFARGRRYSIFECDAEGDVVLTLTDRVSDREADTYMVERGDEAGNLDKATRFLKA